MPQIGHADLNTYLDACANFYVKLLGVSGGYGMGRNYGEGATWGSAQSVEDLKALMLAITDAVIVNDLINPIVQLGVQIGGKEAAAAYLSPLLSSLQLHMAKQQLANVRTLNDYLLYYNTGAGAGTWNVLQASQLYDILGAWNGGLYPSPSNLYFEVLQGATYANALGKTAIVAGVPTYTDGVLIDSTKYAGGYPKLKVNTRTGTDVVTVTGTAFNPATNAIVAGVTWTVTVNAVGVLTLVPGTAPVDSLILGSDSFVAGASLTALDAYIEAHRPAGRPLIA